MKKFMIIVSIIIGACLGYVGYYWFSINPQEEVEIFFKAQDKTIQRREKKQWKTFEIRGVNLGTGKPGKWGSENAIDKKTYLRWFKQIQDMGANTIRIYTVLNQDFYEAFYKYNKQNKQPLYLIQGIDSDDYAMNSHRDAFDAKIQNQLIKDGYTAIDIIHGNERGRLDKSQGVESYNFDISKWVIGYIIGREWVDSTVVYTNFMNPKRTQYEGIYLQTRSDATPFETMLCEVGDKLIGYETKRYKQQRLIAFSNNPTVNSFAYTRNEKISTSELTEMNGEHIKVRSSFKAGIFAAYHAYPKFLEVCNQEKKVVGNFKFDSDSYTSYLKQLNASHSIPVVISEYGATTARGRTQSGCLNEKEQGEAIVNCYNAIKNSGCSGSIIFSWQDEWYKRAWNTIHSVDLLKTPYWSDCQTNSQYYGLVSFDPGKEKSICYVDGDISEWSPNHIVSENCGMSVSVMYDEKFLYFKIFKKDYDKNKDVLYIPIDLTPKSGSNYCKNLNLKFEKESDFLIIIDGEINSKVMVQERYEVLRAMFSHEISNEDAYITPVERNSPNFNPISLIIVTNTYCEDMKEEGLTTYETGKLLHGNANPKSEKYNSISDFSIKGENVEIKIPWQMLNFSNPSEMKIHDDYYEHYGIEELKINEMYVGIGCNSRKEKRIPMKAVELKGWKEDVHYHERLKESYYLIKNCWTKTEGLTYEN